MTSEQFEKIVQRLRFDAQGLIPCIIQDRQTQKVLTLCYMTAESLRKTLDEKFVYLFRRSQNKLMKKGETSGHVQRFVELRPDCEGKSLLMLIDQKVAGCHKGYFSCYFERFDGQGGSETTDPLVFDPKKVY